MSGGVQITTTAHGTIKQNNIRITKHKSSTRHNNKTTPGTPGTQNTTTAQGQNNSRNTRNNNNTQIAAHRFMLLCNP
jgi:hypothetical protein